MTAYAIFGDRFVKAAGSEYPWKTGHPFKGNAKKLRNLSKSVQYASQYWATVETVHRVITQTETDNGDGTTSLPYLQLSLREVRMMHEKWVTGAKFDAGWERELMLWRANGYLVESVMGRRRDFLDGENPNELVNFPIQAAGAALMNIAMLRLFEEIPFEKWGPGTGIINQCHDSIVVECPESEGPKVAALLGRVHESYTPVTPRSDNHCHSRHRPRLVRSLRRNTHDNGKRQPQRPRRH